MLRILSLVVVSAMAGVMPSMSLAGDLCAAAGGTVGRRACVESSNGIAVADDQARAQLLLEDADAGVARFTERFGRAPARFAVVEMNDGNVEGAPLAALRAVGFKAVLPWLSPKGIEQQIEASVRRAVEARSATLPPDAREAAVQAAIARVKATRSQSIASQNGVIAHELGHMWYIDAFWPGTVTSRGHYGGPGPDWMDETAAILMESEALASGRVSQFSERYHALRAAGMLTKAPDNLLVDLPGFFESTHPGTERARALAAAVKRDATGSPPKDGATIVVTSGPEGEAFGKAILHYYLQSTMVSQYLADRTGDPAVFARIGAAFSRGETMAQWLANAEPKGKLPRALTALQADWLAWLEKRFPAA